ncbi:tolB protein precursor, periplasmic protein involved in the tonb-independent uptake of group A colicins [hydrothermal vent metagenome]|uniref:TolB protein, periplasmic protein involved in the tonb-independent uptake of group A colicins n=1 Tax=hydrothermal vent metagenome TaxID=652676 RepID=A0A3B0UX47_9ZZZZ
MTKRMLFWGIVLLLAACSSRSETEEAEIPTASKPVSGFVFTSERDGNWEIYWMAEDGSGVTRLTETEISEGGASWSPDGRSLAFWSRREGNADIFVMAADGSNPLNMAADPKESGDEEFYTRWHPDGQSIAFFSNRFDNAGYSCATHRVGIMPLAGGTAGMIPIQEKIGNQETLAWSPDGKSLAFSSKSCGGSRINIQLYLWQVDNSEVTQLTRDEFINAGPAFSRNGRYFAYHSFRGDNSEIILLDLQSGEETNLSNHPAKDSHPTWSPDDSQIAFVTNRDGNDEIYVMDVNGNNLQNLTNHPARDFEPQWSPIP